MNLAKEFDELIEKCNMGIDDIEPIYRYEQYKKAFLNEWDKLPDDEPIAFFGAGGGLHAIFGIIFHYKPFKNVVCIIDNSSRISEVENNDCKYYFKIPLIHFNQVDNFKFKKIFITPFGDRRNIKRQLAFNKPDVEVIDIYEIMKKNGIVCENAFVDSALKGDLYLYIYKIRAEYETETEKFARQALLSKLIRIYLYIRDFVYAIKFIEEYKKLDYDESDKYSDFLLELEHLFDRTKQYIKSRNSRNIYVFVIDSLTPDAMSRMRFLLTLSLKGLVFENAFSPSLSTENVMHSIFCEEHYINSNLDRPLNYSQSTLLKDLRNNEYKFKYISIQSVNNLDFETNEIYLNPWHSPTNSLQSQMYWNMLTDMVSDSSKSVVVVHSLYETHMFFSCGYHKRKPILDYASEINTYRENPYFDVIQKEIKERIMIQQLEASDYVDKQIEFYTKFIDFENSSAIFTADHGVDIKSQLDFQTGSISTRVGCNDYALRVPLIVRSNKLKPGVYREMFSNIDLGKIIKSIIDGACELDLKNNNYVVFSHDPMMRRAFIEKYLLADMDNGKISLNSGIIGIRTQTERYVYCFDGVEFYFILPNEDMRTDNLIDDIKYKDRIDYLRSIIAPKGMDALKEHIKKIYEHPRYRFSKAVFIDKIFERPYFKNMDKDS